MLFYDCPLLVLADDGKGAAKRRQRRGLEAEKVDRLDRLAEQHVARLSGERASRAPKQQPAKQPSSNKQGKVAAGKGAVPTVELGLTAGSLKRWFDDA